MVLPLGRFQFDEFREAGRRGLFTLNGGAEVGLPLSL